MVESHIRRQRQRRIDEPVAEPPERLAAQPGVRGERASAVIQAANDEIVAIPRGAALLSLLHPGRNSVLLDALAKHGVTALALELVPRITRAQSMDVLSSQANLAGYKAELLAADALP